MLPPKPAIAPAIAPVTDTPSMHAAIRRELYSFTLYRLSLIHI